MEQKACKDCGVIYPVTREFFGQYKNTRSDGSIKIAFRNSCRKCMAENTKKYDRANPDNVRQRVARRQQAAQLAGGSYTSADIDLLRQKLNDCCRFCGSALHNGGQIEHLTPIARGGSNNPNNLTLSCRSCNYEKTSKTLNEYLEWRKERNLFIRKVAFIETPDTPNRARGRRSY